MVVPTTFALKHMLSFKGRGYDDGLDEHLNLLNVSCFCVNLIATFLALFKGIPKDTKWLRPSLWPTTMATHVL